MTRPRGRLRASRSHGWDRSSGMVHLRVASGHFAREAVDLDSAKLDVDADVVDALQRACDQERRAERDAYRDPGGEWRDGRCDVAGGVRIGGGRGAFARVDDGD